jgi:hypothetical protein
MSLSESLAWFHPAHAVQHLDLYSPHSNAYMLCQVGGYIDWPVRTATTPIPDFKI